MQVFKILLAAITLLGTAKLQAQTDTLSISLLQTADIHGQLDAHDELFVEDGQLVFRERGGLAHIKTLFDSEKAKNPDRTLIVDSGDLIQGSGYAARSQGRIFPPIVREMGYDLLQPGKWEVVYGKDIMLEVMNAYNTNIIVQNMKHEDSGEPLFTPYWTTEIEGIKLAFIGINDPDVPVRQNPSFSEGIAFNPINQEVKALIRTVQEKEKPAAVFLMTHIGIFKQVDLANSEAASGVDYVLGSDTHERIRKPIRGKHAKVTEPGAFGSFVGKLTVENPMDNMITDALRWKTGADIALSNGFRFGNPIVPKKGAAAPITRGDIYNMLPVNDYVKTGKVSGQQLLDWLEKEIHNVFAANPMERFGGWLVRFSGMEVTFVANAPRGQRVQEVRINGAPLQKQKTYSLATCVRPGDPDHALCRLHHATDVAVEDYTLHQALEDYLKVHSPIAPRVDGRARATDLGPLPFSTVPGTNYEFR